MRTFFILSLFSTLLLSNSDCKKNKTNAEVLMGRLEIKGICLNYTIKLLKGNIDSSLISSKWVDENTGKEYVNVFGLQNPCVIPETLNIGDEFSFTIDTTTENDCMKCEAYYPTPPRSLKIKVIED